MTSKEFGGGTERTFTVNEWRTKEESQKIKACITQRGIDSLAKLGHFPQKRASEVVFEFRKMQISNIDETPKFSKGYYNCIGCVVVGQKPDGKNISLLTHQITRDDPAYFLVGRLEIKEGAPPTLDSKLKEFISQVKRGTVDAVLFGGQYDEDNADGEEGYAEAIKSTAKTIRLILGFDPTVISGPALAGKIVTDVAFDTETRRLWIIRGKHQTGPINDSFSASEVRKTQKNFTKNNS